MEDKIEVTCIYGDAVKVEGDTLYIKRRLRGESGKVLEPGWRIRADKNSVQSNSTHCVHVFDKHNNYLAGYCVYQEVLVINGVPFSDDEIPDGGFTSQAYTAIRGNLEADSHEALLMTALAMILQDPQLDKLDDEAGLNWYTDR